MKGFSFGTRLSRIERGLGLDPRTLIAHRREAESRSQEEFRRTLAGLSDEEFVRVTRDPERLARLAAPYVRSAPSPERRVVQQKLARALAPLSKEEVDKVMREPARVASLLAAEP